MTREEQMGRKVAGRKVGRPQTNRVALSLRVSPAVRKRLEDRVKETGRSISQEAELLMEQTLQYERAFEAMRGTIKEIEERNVEAALVRRGWTWITDVRGKLWVSPDFPIERSHWVPMPPEEPKGEG
jgi:hypothetical protein